MNGAAEIDGAVDLRVPGDKSITHRALLLAALSAGRCELRRPLASADTLTTAATLRALGCRVSALTDSCIVEGVGLRGLTAPASVLDCGNSGTTARLLMGALAGHAFDAVLTGDASLRARPMRRVLAPLAQMGAFFEELGAPDRLPVRVHGGALRPLSYASPHASAQVKSAILLAGLTGSADVRITEPVLSRDHTERMLERLGVPLVRTVKPGGAAVVALRPVAQLASFDLDVPGDISSAAFIAAFACLAADRRAVRIRDVGLNPTRLGFLRVLERMGASVRTADVRETCGEPIGDVILRRSRLSGATITPQEVPSLIDELPVIAVLAARAEGVTTVSGAGELRVKESDRIRALVDNLRGVGVTVEERADGFTVEGTSRRLSGRVTSHGDHRIAMAFQVLTATGNGAIDVDDMSSAAVSFPGFAELLAAVRAAVSV